MYELERSIWCSNRRTVLCVLALISALYKSLIFHRSLIKKKLIRIVLSACICHCILFVAVFRKWNRKCPRLFFFQLRELLSKRNKTKNLQSNLLNTVIYVLRYRSSIPLSPLSAYFIYKEIVIAFDNSVNKLLKNLIKFQGVSWIYFVVVLGKFWVYENRVLEKLLPNEYISDIIDHSLLNIRKYDIGNGKLTLQNKFYIKALDSEQFCAKCMVQLCTCFYLRI